jgi:iron(III) transport system permease protein
MAVMLVQAAVPLASEAILTGGWGEMLAATSAAAREIRFTLWVGIAAGLLAVPLGLALASQLARVRGGRSVWWFLAVVPLVIPSSLVGIGLILIWNRAHLPPVYGSRWMPVLGALARFTPVAAIALLAQLKRVDPALLEAARIYQRDDWQTWVRVRVPLLAPGLLAAAGLVFVLTAGELGATLLIAPPGLATLTMRIYNYLHYGASETVAGLGLVMSLGALFSAAIAALGFIAWARLAEGR